MRQFCGSPASFRLALRGRWRGRATLYTRTLETRQRCGAMTRRPSQSGASQRVEQSSHVPASGTAQRAVAVRQPRAARSRFAPRTFGLRSGFSGAPKGNPSIFAGARVATPSVRLPPTDRPPPLPLLWLRPLLRVADSAEEKAADSARWMPRSAHRRSILRHQAHIAPDGMRVRSNGAKRRFARSASRIRDACFST